MGKRFKKRFYNACCFIKNPLDTEVEGDRYIKKDGATKDPLEVKTRSPRISEAESIVRQLDEMYKHISESISQLEVKINDAILQDVVVLSRYFVKRDESKTSENSALEECPRRMKSSLALECQERIEVIEKVEEDVKAVDNDEPKLEGKEEDEKSFHQATTEDFSHDIYKMDVEVNESCMRKGDHEVPEKRKPTFDDLLDQAVREVCSESGQGADEIQSDLQIKYYTNGNAISDPTDVAQCGSTQPPFDDIHVVLQNITISQSEASVMEIPITGDDKYGNGLDIKRNSIPQPVADKTQSTTPSPTDIISSSLSYDELLDLAIHEVANEDNENLTHFVKTSSHSCETYPIKIADPKINQRANIKRRTTFDEMLDQVIKEVCCTDDKSQEEKKEETASNALKNVSGVNKETSSPRDSVFDDMLDQAIRKVTTQDEMCQNSKANAEPVSFPSTCTSSLDKNLVKIAPVPFDIKLEKSAKIPQLEEGNLRLTEAMQPGDDADGRIPDGNDNQITRTPLTDHTADNTDHEAYTKSPPPIGYTVMSPRRTCEVILEAENATSVTSTVQFEQDQLISLKIMFGEAGSSLTTEAENTKEPFEQDKKSDLVSGHFGDGDVASLLSKDDVTEPLTEKDKIESSKDSEGILKNNSKLKDVFTICGTPIDENRLVPKPKLSVTLLDLMQKRLPLLETHARFVCLNLLDILNYLQTRGVVHTNICPRNVVFSDVGYPCLTGLRDVPDKNIGVLQPEPRIEFTSPEQIIDGHVTEGTDAFSIGVLGFNMIYGRPPHKAATYKETKENILYDNYIPKFEPDGHLSKAGKRFLVWCIRKDLGKRFNVKKDGNYVFNSVEWFKDYDVKALSDTTYPSPFIQLIHLQTDD